MKEEEDEEMEEEDEDEEEVKTNISPDQKMKLRGLANMLRTHNMINTIMRAEQEHVSAMNEPEDQEPDELDLL